MDFKAYTAFLVWVYTTFEVEGIGDGLITVTENDGTRHDCETFSDECFHGVRILATYVK